MDANKLKVLRELPYTVRRVCGLCYHGRFILTLWGTCDINEYEHQKHTDETRALSIHQYGSCPDFQLSGADVGTIGAFAALLEESDL